MHPLSSALRRRFPSYRYFQRSLLLLLAGLLGVCLSTPVRAQYFGRNKVTYETYNFQVMTTDHFDLHFYPNKYPEGAQAIKDVARMTERWYDRQSGVMNHSFILRKPIILYENQTDFHQTNIISNLGEGTGGVTEALKSRLIMPLTGRYADTDHVMGHEMVHEFQYDIALQGRGLRGLQSMSRLPLWMIEGMAEYLSVGPDDPQSALWIRDALRRDALPSPRDLSRRMQEYFPYRWGHAFWAYVAGRQGDAVVPQLFRGSLERGFYPAIDSLIGISADSLFREWHASIRDMYADELARRTNPDEVGTPLISKDGNGTRMNLAPSVSPNGEYVVYISEESLFSIDLFLANARTGERITKLTSTALEGHFNALRFIDSAGSWSPDGEQFVFVVFNKGSNELAFLDVESRQITRQIRIRGVEEITNPAWSPDGNEIAFSGITGGQSDLYVHDLSSGETRRLTDDRYADLQPTWAPDGRSIAFTTDRGPATDFDRLTYGSMQIAVLDMDDQSIRRLNLFANGKHIDPKYSPDGRSLYFVSNQDGFSDIYRVSLATRQIYRVTRIATGVHGITDTSPVLSVGREGGRLLMTVFEEGAYNIHALEAEQARGKPIASPASGSIVGHLPPSDDTEPQLVQGYLNNPEQGLPPLDVSYDVRRYRPSLQLDYISGSGGVNIGSGGFASDQFGIGGGLYMSFSDMLGDHQLAATVLANGTFKDLGGQAYYINQRRRLQWGGVVGHVPYLSTYTTFGVDPIETDDGTVVPARYVGQIRERLYVDQAYGLVAYPFSTTRRWELTTGYTRYGYDRELYQYFIDFGGERRVDIDENVSPLHFVQASTALVEDRSFFGFTSPIMGRRARLEVEPTFGSLQYVTTLADLRNYTFTDPVTWAARAIFIGRFGTDADSPRAQSYYIGYGGLVRGYSVNTFDPEECNAQASTCPAFERLNGSRAIIANAEVRMPLLGSEQFGLLNFPFLPTELVGFVDGGVTWTGSTSPTWAFERRSEERVPVLSTGTGVRLNVMGYLVMHVYYAYPFQRPDKGGHWWVTLGPGW